MMNKFILLLAGFVLLLCVQSASATWSPIHNLSRTPDHHSLWPFVFVDSAGKSHVTWSDGADGRRSVYYTTNVAGGWATPQKISPGMTDTSASAILALPDGTITVFFQRTNPTPKTIFMTQRIQGQWTAPQQVVPSNGQDHWLAPRATRIDSEGTIHLVYGQYLPKNDDWVYHYTSKPLGGPWTVPVIPFDSGWNAYQSGASLVVTGSGANTTLHLALHSETQGAGLSGTRVWYTRKTGAGAWIPAKRLTSGSASMAPSIGIDSVGVLHLAFQEPRDSYWNLFYIKSYDGGDHWTEDVQVTETSRISRAPNLVVDSSDAVHFFWEQETSSKWQAQYRLLKNGQWKPILRLNASDDNCFGPVPAYSNGLMAVVWVDSGLPEGGGMYDVAFRTDNTWLDNAAPAPVNNLIAQPSDGRVYLTWVNSPDFDYHGALIRASTTGYPASPTDGFFIADVKGSPGWFGEAVHSGAVNGATYYYSVFSYDHIPNYSAPAQRAVTPRATTISDIKQMENGINVDMYGKVVTAVYSGDNCVYVADSDRTAGIRAVHSGAGLSVGDIVNITGVTATRIISGYPAERQITPATITRVSGGPLPVPLIMRTSAVGGEAVPSLKPGVKDAIGLNNIGTLATVVGRITYKIGTSIWVDDGAGVPDIPGRIGVLVRCPDTSNPYNVGDMVRVTGVIQGSIPVTWTENRRFIQMRNWSDIEKLD